MPGLFSCRNKNEPLLEDEGLSPLEAAKRAAKSALEILETRQSKNRWSMAGFGTVIAGGVASFIWSFAATTYNQTTADQYDASPCGAAYPASGDCDYDFSLPCYTYCESGQIMGIVNGTDCSDLISKAGCDSTSNVGGHIGAFWGGLTVIVSGAIGMGAVDRSMKKSVKEQLGKDKFEKIETLASQCGISIADTVSLENAISSFKARISALESDVVAFHLPGPGGGSSAV